MKKLWLDDLRPVPDSTWDKVKNYNEFCAYILINGIPDVISFDHDLGREHYRDLFEGKKKVLLEEGFIEKTGYDCAKWLIKKELPVKEFYCHSANPIGKKNILNLLQNWKDYCDENIHL